MEMKIEVKSSGRRMGDVLSWRYMLDKNRKKKTKRLKDILRYKESLERG